jgi:hypothetical protein
MFERRVLRRLFGPKREEIIGGSKTCKIRSFITCTLGIIRSRMKCVGHVARMIENRNAYRILMGELERKRPLGRPKRR